MRSGWQPGASAILAFLFLRAAGIYFLLITMAVAMCVWGLIYRWVSLTGGDNGIMDIPRPHLGLPWNLLDPVYFYYFVLVFFIICFVLLLPSGSVPLREDAGGDPGQRNADEGFGL